MPPGYSCAGKGQLTVSAAWQCFQESDGLFSVHAVSAVFNLEKILIALAHPGSPVWKVTC